MLFHLPFAILTIATFTFSHPVDMESTVETTTDSTSTSTESEVEYTGYFESDIVLSEEQLELVQEAKYTDQNIVSYYSTKNRSARKAVMSTMLWPGASVPYSFDSTITPDVRSTILQAIAHWEQHTCIQFEASEPVGSNFILFFKGRGCWSNIGRATGSNSVNFLSIGSSCNSFGTIVHEIGHAIGFWHEHTRPDRDNYINIHYENIKEGREQYFDTYNVGQGQTYGVPYDLKSIMHYGEYAFTYNLQKTITTKDPSKQSLLRQDETLSFYDIKLANTMYECNAHCPSLTCQNGGYVGLNCQCVCPDETSGSNCQTSTSDPGPVECREQLFGTSGTLLSPNYPLAYPINQICIWQVQVPVGKLISLIFEDFRIDDESGYSGCVGSSDYVEIRDENIITEGIRYCGSIIPPCFTSISNVLFVYFRSNGVESQYTSRFRVRYQAIHSYQSCNEVGSLIATTTTTTTTTEPTTTVADQSESQGIFTTPGYPNNYDNDQICEWIIYAPMNHVIQLEFSDFQLQRSDLFCRNDYIEISLGYEWATPARLCGSGPRRVLTSTSNRMIITFTSDGTHTYRGFVANYQFQQI
ncbi:protein SpAN-like [Glandiceps talaboti]